MTKKEKHQSINREFLNRYENEFEMFDEGDGRIYLDIIDKSECNEYPSDNYIEYHLSRHTVDCFNWADDIIQNKVEEMELFLLILIANHEL